MVQEQARSPFRPVRRLRSISGTDRAASGLDINLFARELGSKFRYPRLPAWAVTRATCRRSTTVRRSQEQSRETCMLLITRCSRTAEATGLPTFLPLSQDKIRRPLSGPPTGVARAEPGARSWPHRTA